MAKKKAKAKSRDVGQGTRDADAATELRTIRVSSLPRIMACGQAAQAPELRVDTSGPEAAMGRAVHEVLADVVRGNLEAVPDLDSYAQKYSVENLDELRMLAWAGVKAWLQLRDDVGVVAVEKAMEANVAGLRLTGHADILGKTEAYTGGLIPVTIDWKSGYLDTDHLDQLKGYLRLGWDKVNPDATTGKAIVIWLRERRIDVVNVSRAELDAWEEDLHDALASPDYCAGEHCGYCPRKLECPARAQIVRSIAADLSAEDAIGELAEAQLASLHPRVTLLKRALKAYDAALKLALADGAKLAIGDGRMLSLEPQQRESVMFERGVTALSLHLGLSSTELRAELEDSITVPKKAIQDLAAAGAGRGNKGRARVEVIDMLREDGAVNVTAFTRLTVKKGT